MIMNHLYMNIKVFMTEVKIHDKNTHPFHRFYVAVINYQAESRA